ncbi:MAG: lasso peptide biosynthesis PqqD family chaperone [Kutzneria sp.]|nr:lasso peptide biosynthesis PqqD family chaperone [Kutzneria sp.]
MRLRDDVTSAETDDGVVLLDEHTGRYWQLNPTAGLVLRDLRDGRSLDDIAEDLATRYRIDPDRVRRDVTAIVDRLAAENLVRRT